MNLAYAWPKRDGPEEALAATEETAEIRRRLAKANPAAFEPDLALTLNNLGVHLAETGRREDGLAASEQAAQVLIPGSR